MLKEKWIKLSILSLTLSGLYSIFIVLLRTPVLTSIFPDKSIFYTSLIVHVNLSVLFWLVSFVMILMTEDLPREYKYFINYSINALFLAVFLIFLSPIIGESKPYLNNYVPILHNLLFIIGIGIFFSVFFLLSILCFVASIKNPNPIAFLGILANISLFISAYKLDVITTQIDEHHFYELLFWGVGHILQFFYCSGFIVVLYKFFNIPKYSIKLNVILWLNNILVIPAIFTQLFIEIDDALYYSLFTEHMKILGGVCVSVSLLSLFIDSIYHKKYPNKLETTAIILSVILFGFGGVLGLAISKINVTVPAHYHGSIVGITLLYMSYIYVLIDKNISNIKISSAINQMMIYSLGQIVHISALAYSGGYGALRKTPGVDLPFEAKIAMGFMGLGGLLAIVGGLYFVYICTRSIYNTQNDKTNQRTSRTGN
jgi:cytochrome c oxidase subunit 1